jgi:hypothetical protein
VGLSLATKTPRRAGARAALDSGRSQRWLAVSDGWKAHPIMLLIGWRLCADFRPSGPRPERGDSTPSGRVTARNAAVFQSVNQVRQLADAKSARVTS